MDPLIPSVDNLRKVMLLQRARATISSNSIAIVESQDGVLLVCTTAEISLVHLK